MAYNDIYSSSSFDKHKNAQNYTTNRRKIICNELVKTISCKHKFTSAAYIGSGLGIYTKILSSLLDFKLIYLIENSAIALDSSCRLNSSLPISSMLGEAEETVKQLNRIDIFFLFFSLHYVHDLMSFFRNLAAKLSKHGKICIVTITKGKYSNPIDLFFDINISQFYDYNDIKNAAFHNNLLNVAKKKICIKEKIKKTLIKDVFCKEANSFLFSISDSELNSFHVFLEKICTNDILNVEYYYDIIFITWR